MPIKMRRDEKGQFYRFGMQGKKYYFNPYNYATIIKAYNKALKQSKAIKASQARKKIFKYKKRY